MPSVVVVLEWSMLSRDFPLSSDLVTFAEKIPADIGSCILNISNLETGVTV